MDIIQNMTQDNFAQDDIDSLFGDEEDLTQKNKGIKALINKATESYKKLPMLEIICERFVNLLPMSLRGFIGKGVDINITDKSLTSLRFGAYINSIPVPALVGIFKLRELNTYGLIIPNSHLTFTLIDILLGGKILKRPIKIEGRPYTSIERAVLQNFSDQVLNELTEAFSMLTNIKFMFDRIETDPRFTAIARPGDSAILMRINIEIEDKKGILEILLPYNSLEPIADLLLKVFLDEPKDTDDTEWKTGLKKHVMGIKLSLEAKLRGKNQKLEDIMKLSVGSTIIMEHLIEENLNIVIEGQKVLSGKIGQSNNKVAVLIEDLITTPNIKK